MNMGYYSDEFLKDFDDGIEDFDIGGADPPPNRRPNRDPIDEDSFFDLDGDYKRPQRRNVNRRPAGREYGVRSRGSSRRPAPRKRRPSRAVRRTLIVAVFVLILVLLISMIAAIVFAFSGVDEVEQLAVTEVSSDQVVLSWQKVKKAQGYHVLMAKGSDEYQQVQTIDDPDTLTATISGLEQVSYYNFSVTAFKGKKESKPASLTNIATLPDTPEITNSFSAKKGSIHLDWTENDKASGYVVEYKKDGGEYSADTTVTISDPAECRADITDLEVNATYTARVYAFASADQQVNSLPSAEVSLKVVAEDTEVLPKAKQQNVDEAIDPNKPMIALTFDDGPAVGEDSGDRILDVLEQYNAKATFFMLGCNAGEALDNLKRKVKLKMEIGNHTWNHVHMGSEVTAEDIRMGSNGIYEACGQFPTCFRSPGGMTTDVILKECAAEGMSAYYWSIDTMDWSSRDADAVYHAVMDNVKDGDIILMHEIYGSTADAVAKMVPELIEQGYQLVTCHDLIAAKGGSEPVPGKQYVDAFREMAP